jgi:pimeloyl-ACP methyl ester carboxylesterase
MTAALAALAIPREAVVTAGGLRLHHLRFRSTGRRVLCLHGVSSHAWSWQEFATAIGRGTSVVAPDLRGHGDSQWSAAGAYGTADHVGDLEGLCDGLAWREVDIVGASWGALIGLRLADRRPDLVRRLVLVDIPPAFDPAAPLPPPPPESYAADELEALERATNQRASAEMVASMALHGYRPVAGGRFARKHDPYFRVRWPFRDEDHWAELGRIRQPLLIVRAGRSAMLDDGVTRRMVAVARSARTTVLPDSGHQVQVDGARDLATVVREFLDGEAGDDG